MLSLMGVGCVGSIYDIEACIFSQTFRHDDALGSLIVFKQCGDDTRECEGRTVECVAEAYLLVVVAIAAFQAVGLIGLEIGDG